MTTWVVAAVALTSCSGSQEPTATDPPPPPANEFAAALRVQQPVSDADRWADVPADPLGLTPDGWTVESRLDDEAWTYDDAHGCDELIEVLALADLPVTLRSYRRLGSGNGTGLGVSMDVWFVDYSSDEAATRRLLGFTDPLLACSGEPAGDRLEIPSISVPAPFDGFGYVDGEQLAWATGAADGRTVIVDAIRLPVGEPQAIVDRVVEFLSTDSP